MGNNLGQKVMRRKAYEEDIMNTKLDRCLGTLDIAMFGVSHMIGAGIFVLTGTLISRVAGPAAVLSFVLAGISSLLTAFCYAELATRLPKAGSSYTYTYFAFGELPAFFVGWMMILDFLIGMAAIAKGFGATVDAISRNAVRNWTIGLMGGPIETSPFSEYPDLVALSLVVAAAAVTASGAKIGLRINVAIALLLTALLALMIVASYTYADTRNWTEHGGFMPFGYSGVLSGASIAVYAFAGFDHIANTSEEARDPRKSIPIATLAALSIVTVLYLNASLGLSLLSPYDQISASAPFAYAFMRTGQFWLYVIACFTTLLATSGGKLVEMYVAPRLLYALASDGLLFPIFGTIWERTKVPIFGLLIAAGLCAVLAVFIQISVLADIASVGMLLSYIVAGIDVILIRYNNYDIYNTSENPEGQLELVDSVKIERRTSLKYPRLKKNLGCLSRPLVTLVQGAETENFNSALWIYVSVSFALNGLSVYGLSTDIKVLWWMFAAFLVPLGFFIVWIAGLVICTYEPASNDRYFELPFMPIIPLFSISINTFLLMTIKPDAWIRFVVCGLAGLVVYFSYGIRHSHCAYDGEEQRLIKTDKTIDSKKEDIGSPPLE